MKDCGNHPSSPYNRRDFLNTFGWGVGGLSLASLFGINSQTAEAVPAIATKQHFPVKAKSIIQLFYID